MSIRPLNNYGERLAEVADPNAVGVQVVANPAAKQSVPPIEIGKIRNGQHPNAWFQNQINTQANAAVLYRSKEVFSGNEPPMASGTIGSFGAGDRARWRFAFNTGPYTHALYYVVVMAQPTSGLTNNTYGRLDLFTDTSESSVVASGTFAYGNDPSNGTDGGLNMLKLVAGFIDGISADTAYYARFVDVNYGVIQSASIFDLQSMTEHTGGYLAQNVTTHTPITNLQRSLVVDINNALWQKGGAQVLNWSVNDGTAPITRASATAINIIDGTSTTISASTPGYTLDMTGKDRLSQTSGVPCIMKAFMKTSPDATKTASVYLKDSGGSTIATCSTTSTTAGWVSSGSFNLPATVAKYDLMLACTAGGTGSLYAVSVYEYG